MLCWDSRELPWELLHQISLGSPALLELLDLVLELSTTSPGTNESFEAGHFIC